MRGFAVFLDTCVSCANWHAESPKERAQALQACTFRPLLHHAYYGPPGSSPASWLSLPPPVPLRAGQVTRLRGVCL